MISKKKVVNDLASILASYEVKHVVISPGSRNAPFILSFTNNPSFTCYSIVDERSAGYIALGIAQETQKPVAVICTSGTAGLNYFPAIAEAYFQHLPLVVITADRPTERIGQGEGQSVFQTHVFGKHVKAFAELLENENCQDAIRSNHRKIAEAMSACLTPNHGPVHFNVPLSESLYETQSFPTAFPTPIRTSLLNKEIADSELTELKKTIEQSSKTLVLIGSLTVDEELSGVIARWSSGNNALVLTETTSNLVDNSFIQCIDRFIMSLTDEEVSTFAPDLLITIGDNLISKKIKFLLRSVKPDKHWHIDEGDSVMDTFQSLTRVIGVAPKTFFSSTTIEQKAKSNYATDWRLREEKIQLLQEEYNKEVGFSDYKVVKTILDQLPTSSILQMGNSSLVRYVQLFDPRPDILYYSNRGTSGIDGCVSTAVGQSIVSNKKVYLLVGDISFFYDNNALWNRYLTKRLKIILVNNGGGGIFNIIEGPSKTESLDYFTTNHQRTAKNTCRDFGVEYFQASSQDELLVGLVGLKNASNCALLEVNTMHIENDKNLKEFFNYISKT